MLPIGEDINFSMLDVGCGTTPRGDVNIDFFRSGFNRQIGDQITGEFVCPKEIKNFIVGDAMHLPFKDASFKVVFSSNTIEHMRDPLLMLKELCRVAKNKVIVRYPHVRGSGAVMPHHLNYFDERWFNASFHALGFKSMQFVTEYDYPITNRIKKFCPAKIQRSLLWKALRHFERERLNVKFQIPFEMEAWAKKKINLSDSGELRFVVVYDSSQVFESCFASGFNVSSTDVSSYYNIDNLSLPMLYNKAVEEHVNEDVWFVFCHQDFLLNEDLRSRLNGKDIEVIYGPIGSRVAANSLLGSIIQRDGTHIGRTLKEDTPVQTLDEMCLIAHATVFRQGLSFDEQFAFHFYGADFCMQAYTKGFDVLAMQVDCQHRSKNLTGDVISDKFLSSLKIFKGKWKQFLPVRTTTKLIT